MYIAGDTSKCVINTTYSYSCLLTGCSMTALHCGMQVYAGPDRNCHTDKVPCIQYLTKYLVPHSSHCVGLYKSTPDKVPLFAHMQTSLQPLANYLQVTVFPVICNRVEPNIVSEQKPPLTLLSCYSLSSLPKAKEKRAFAERVFSWEEAYVRLIELQVSCYVWTVPLQKLHCLCFPRPALQAMPL